MVRSVDMLHSVAMYHTTQEYEADLTLQGDALQRPILHNSPVNGEEKETFSPNKKAKPLPGPIPEIGKSEQAIEKREKIAAHVFDVTLYGNAFPPMLRTMRLARKLGLPDNTLGYVAEDSYRAPRSSAKPSKSYLDTRSNQMLRDLRVKKMNPEWRERLFQREKLPVMTDSRHARLIKALDSCDVLVVPGSTGSGKSTQVPQIILDYAIHDGKGAHTNVICSQPRRISAVSIARRVAWERTEDLGQTVGHHIRFSPQLPHKHGHILYCTNGILWNYMHHQPDHVLDTASHIVLDEVHERSTEIDILMLILRKLILNRKAQGKRYPKVVLMSATIESNEFIEYFRQPLDGKHGLTTSKFEIPGRLFPITDHYLEDISAQLSQSSEGAIGTLSQGPAAMYINAELESNSSGINATLQSDSDAVSPTIETPSLIEAGQDYIVPFELAAATVMHVFQTTRKGDILVFFPGLNDINKTADLLEAQEAFWNQNTPEGGGVKIFRLHSQLNDTNDEVFEPVALGWRRIVLASNIAETSITLPEVEHVIDTGTSKLMTRDSETASRGLLCQWASRQSLQQRRGRAGRVKPGNYYALYSRAREFETYLTPELLREDLMGTALGLKTMVQSLDIATGLTSALDSPKEEDIAKAIHGLKQIGALTEAEEVTPLGRMLSSFGTHPNLAKAVILGVLFRCLEPMLIAASMDDGGEGMIAKADRTGVELVKTRYHYARGTDSNIIASINAFKELDDAITSGDTNLQARLCSTHGLRRDLYHYQARTARQICERLHAQGIASIPDLGAGYFPNIPPELNTNATCTPLVKVLLMLSLQPELAARWSAHTFFSKQGLLMPEWRAVNSFLSAGLLRSGVSTRVSDRGDLMSYAFGKFVPDGNRIGMVDTQTITPLMAMLFGREVALGDSNTATLDKAIKVKINVQGHEVNLPTSKAAVMTMEMRKMIERFLHVAFSDLRIDGKPTAGKVSQYNTMFTEKHELRDAFTKGLIEILDADAEAEKTVLDERWLAWTEEDSRKLSDLAKRQAEADKKKAKPGISNEEAVASDKSAVSLTSIHQMLSNLPGRPVTKAV
ncbi:uncharacterized protein HMPREF1541_01926 [Cyphellophora europaea CBS 101466]|uniref:Helicase ATP-binding domain-containing protein n=1 Tax=Cyphellophora europaea (strain CBS 101466) TaxID=1220924 RepID=W2S3Y7_CYPE1|nr:uncharacterized protein HMPREF1541_01926 [Cyphellophora europaea CBS 101466]ETN42768.1 hypothetical protein HMPREF1541_01926 [Cyphellophora europaea CBS 101466]